MGADIPYIRLTPTFIASNEPEEMLGVTLRVE